MFKRILVPAGMVLLLPGGGSVSVKIPDLRGIRERPISCVAETLGIWTSGNIFVGMWFGGGGGRRFFCFLMGELWLAGLPVLRKLFLAGGW